MSRLAPLDLFIRQALLYPLVSPFLPPVDKVEAGYSYAAGRRTGTMAGIESGTIVIWKGSIASIPSGWVLCDGNNGTPDLRNKFIVGAGNEYNPDDTGGEKEHILSVSEIPAHTHTIRARSNRNDNEGPNTEAKSGEDNTTFNSGSTGGGGAHENRPPFYALAFIMKT